MLVYKENAQVYLPTNEYVNLLERFPQCDIRFSPIEMNKNHFENLYKFIGVKIFVLKKNLAKFH